MAILKYLRKKGKYAGSIGSGKVNTPTTSNPTHFYNLNSLKELKRLNDSRFPDPNLINLDNLFAELEETELGKKWKSNPKDMIDTRKHIQDTLDYIVLADGRFGTFLSLSNSRLGILLVPPVNKKIRKEALARSLDRKSKLETIIKNEKADDITRYLATLSLVLWNEGEKLAEEIEDHHKREANDATPWNLLVYIPSYEERQAVYKSGFEQSVKTYFPLMERAIAYAKRTKEINDFLDESRKTASTPDQWIKKFEKKAAKASRAYSVMTEHLKNGAGFNDDDGKQGIRLTREEYNNRKSSYSSEEIEDARLLWREALADLNAVKAVLNKKVTKNFLFD